MDIFNGLNHFDFSDLIDFLYGKTTESHRAYKISPHYLEYEIPILNEKLVKKLVARDTNGINKKILNKEWTIMIPPKVDHSRVYLVYGLHLINFLAKNGLQEGIQKCLVFIVFDPFRNQLGTEMETVDSACIHNIRSSLNLIHNIPRGQRLFAQTLVLPTDQVSKTMCDYEVVSIVIDLMRQWHVKLFQLKLTLMRSGTIDFDSF